MHDAHLLRSGDGTVPAPHGAQLSAPTAPDELLCVLFSQRVHAAGVTCPTDTPSSMNVPARHRVHCACPGEPA